MPIYRVSQFNVTEYLIEADSQKEAINKLGDVEGHEEVNYEVLWTTVGKEEDD